MRLCHNIWVIWTERNEWTFFEKGGRQEKGSSGKVFFFFFFNISCISLGFEFEVISKSLVDCHEVG